MPVNLDDLGRFGRYELSRRISLGGMAEVFKAKSYGEHGFEKVVALKRILPTVAESERFQEMFVQEASIAAHLDHPNICRIYELGREGESYYLTMEFIYGHDVREVLRRCKHLSQPVPSAIVAQIGADVARALDHAWRAPDERGEPLRLVHRDVSPQNVMIGFDGVVKLIDFGIAKVANASVQTAAGVLKGKYAYMSPEQAEAKPLDAAADIWSLGVVLHELLAGRRLFLGSSVADTIEQILLSPIPHLDDAPPVLASIVRRALERDVEVRYRSHAEVLGDLDGYLTSLVEPPTPEQVAAFMDSLFPESTRLESDLSERDVRIVLSAEERGEETTDAKGDLSSATQIFLADSTGQAEYRAVLEALLARGKLQTRDVSGRARVAPAASPAPWSVVVWAAASCFLGALLGLWALSPL